MACLEMRNIHKFFPGVYALQGIDFTLEEGEVCGLVGENGAGKSTLMNILGGIYKADEGDFHINGEKVSITNPKDAENLGISFIHQELSLFENLDIASNIFISNLPTDGLFISKNILYKKTIKILKRIGLDNHSPNKKISELKIGEKQLVEIGRALAVNTKILILDEPTSSLTDSEIEVLFEIVNNLKNEGISVIFITHRLDEIFNICDSVMVLRDGKRIVKDKINNFTRAQIVHMMLG